MPDHTPRYIALLLVDVSGSMTASMASAQGGASRLENVRDALNRLVQRGREAAATRESGVGAALPLAHLLVYAFGFGNPLAELLGRSGPRVRDLLKVAGTPRAVPLDELAADWPTYERHIERLVPEMFGATPLVEALGTVTERLQRELAAGHYTSPPVVFLLSDGAPTDGPAAAVIAAAERLRTSTNATLISCYVTDRDLGNPRLLYAQPQAAWDPGASLMFEIASPVDPASPLKQYLDEYRWAVPPGARLFTQVNHSEVLSEFLNMTVSQTRVPAALLAAAVPAARPVRIFITYSHRDANYLREDDFLGFLRELERHGVSIWHDARIATGDQWDDAIRREIEQSDVAIALVSQDFLNSQYCQNVEISEFLRRRASHGLRIYPIILRPCTWRRHEWLAATQSQPRDGRSIERDYQSRPDREQLYVEITDELSALINELGQK